MRIGLETGVFIAWLLAPVCLAQRASDSADAHMKLAAGFLQKRDYAEALPELRKALELQPDLLEAHGMLGQALLAQGFSAEAIPHLERARKLDLLGIALAEEHRSGQAIEKLLAALEAKPDDPDLLYHLGKASSVLLQRSFDRLVRADPGSARAHQLMAETYAAQQQVEPAGREYRKALEIQPDLRKIHLALGMIQMNAGNLEEAEKEFRAETALSPGDAEAAWRLGSVLLRKGRSAEALAELERSDRLRPQMIETLFDLAKAYNMVNKTSEAEKAWLGLIGIDDSGEVAAAAHFQLAQLYRRQGNTTEAERHSKRFQELQPKGSLRP
jgi:tetratricopeptide (TPR) repeat protein